MRDFDTPYNHCPKCGHYLDACTNVDADREPEPGDVSVCMYCGVFLGFNENRTVRYLTDAELENMPTHLMASLTKVQQAIRLVNEKRRKCQPPPQQQ